MDDDEFFEDEDEGNADGWIVTFSDLMSLLLCFFVLILSMAEVAGATRPARKHWRVRARAI